MSALKSKSHYNQKYFNNYQLEIGEFGGIANKFKFQKHISKNDTVLDFGCGGGFLLNNIDCKNKIGIELNPTARKFCKKNFNIECFSDLSYVNDNSIDTVISNHCLEHTPNPNELISILYKKLKRNGKIIICVPLDSRKLNYAENDINFHLYSFSAMNLGNLLTNNNFKLNYSKILYHKWPPFFYKMK